MCEFIYIFHIYIFNIYHKLAMYMQVPRAQEGQAYDLICGYPRKTIAQDSTQTLAEADILNSKLIMKWL
jgi:UBX domain